MSLFEKIKSAIFGKPAPAPGKRADLRVSDGFCDGCPFARRRVRLCRVSLTLTLTITLTLTLTPSAAPRPASAPAAQQAQAPTAAAGRVAGAPSAPQQQVDVEAVLTDLASQNKEKLDWRNSIVDLMKLVDLDSSLEPERARKGAGLHRRHERHGPDEHLAAQAGHAEARGKRRQGARRSQALNRPSTRVGDRAWHERKDLPSPRDRRDRHARLRCQDTRKDPAGAAMRRGVRRRSSSSSRTRKACGA